MKPIAELSATAADSIDVVLTDIDGTLTRSGEIVPAAFSALARLRAAGIAVVPITGRPAGWCDAMARQWPVAGVVGENGALAFARRDGRIVRTYHPEATEEARAKLEEIRDEILETVPGSRVASDQAFRMFDLAIDFAEDPPDLGLDAANEIRAIFTANGAHAKISSIHVNGWFGDYDKLSMTRLFLREHLDIDVEQEPQRVMFVGDSPNDEPMFEFFDNSCGVANVASFVTTMQHLPTYICQGDGGDGFAELVDVLLERRRR